MSEKQLYLGDVIPTGKLTCGALNLIVAPCGSGKTTAAINVLAKLASSPAKVLYLIDTINGCKRLQQNPALTTPCQYYEDTLDSRFPSTDFHTDPNKIVVTTYAKFGVWSRRKADFFRNYEMIICDELQSCIEYTHYSKDNSPNYAACAAAALQNALRASSQGILGETATAFASGASRVRKIGGKGGRGTMVVAITATPQKIYDTFSPINIIPIDTSVLRSYTTAEVRHYGDIVPLLRSLSPELHGAIYSERITPMLEYEAILRSCGHSPISLWSPANEDHPMSDLQLATLDTLLTQEVVPPSYNILLFNKSLETSINIRSPMDFMILHNSNSETQTQARGRLRSNLPLVYLHDSFPAENASSLVLPPQFINRQLFSDDKAELFAFLSLQKSNGKGKATQKETLEAIRQSGYSITEGRSKNKRYTIISPAVSTSST